MAHAQVKKPERGSSVVTGSARLAVRLDEAHQHEAAAIGAAPQFGNRGGALPRAVYQHAALEDILVHETRKYGARQVTATIDATVARSMTPRPTRSAGTTYQTTAVTAMPAIIAATTRTTMPKARARWRALYRPKANRHSTITTPKTSARGHKRPVNALERRQITAEAHVGGENECRTAQCELDDCEHRNRDVHVLTDQANAHRSVVRAIDLRS
jgi:hypothetical protein